jgi:hypothetical protein
VAGVVQQDGSRQVCHIRGGKTNLDSGTHDVSADYDWPYCIVSRGIEFHDGSVHRKVGRMPGRILVDEEFRGE